MRGHLLRHPTYAGGDDIKVGHPVFVVGVGAGTVTSVNSWNVEVDFGESADTVSPDMLEYLGPRLGGGGASLSVGLAYAFIGLVTGVAVGVLVWLLVTVWGWVL